MRPKRPDRKDEVGRTSNPRGSREWIFGSTGVVFDGATSFGRSVEASELV
jgi:hypothetical protein